VAGLHFVDGQIVIDISKASQSFEMSKITIRHGVAYNIESSHGPITYFVCVCVFLGSMPLLFPRPKSVHPAIDAGDL
jgi:hypothetical protein